MRTINKALLLSLLFIQFKGMAKNNDILYWSYLSYQINEENTECRKTYMTRIFKLTADMDYWVVQNTLNNSLVQNGFETVIEKQITIHRFQTFYEAHLAWNGQLKLENKEAKKSDYKVFCDPQVLEWIYEPCPEEELTRDEIVLTAIEN